ncbi:MAG: fused MFS/spermidine synthase [Candidatus Accumulibacter sp.]|nr:fused MFS/spermidine synthase [Accumulibacter sp.]
MPELLTTLCLSLCCAQSACSQEILYQERSLYRNILVFEEQGLRCMKFGIHASGRQSCVSLKDPDNLVFNYTLMLLGALYLNPDPKRILIIGLGGGTLPTTLRKILPKSQIDCVEIDPAVAKVAAKYFGFSPQAGINVSIEDGRVFVKRAQRGDKKYDLIVLDAFDQVYIPEHMLTREYLQEVNHLLDKGGILAANTFSSSKLYFSESATYADVFGVFYNLKMENRIILAKKGGLPKIEEIQRNAGQMEEKLKRFGTGKDWLLPLFSTDVQWPPATRLLTDQYSPANLLNGP